MAKNVNHIQHVKSNVLVDGTPKLPQPSALVEGEIAVNYADGYETLSIKTSSGNIATFSSDKYYTEQHLGSAFTGDNSANTVTSWVGNKERAVAAALVDLNERKMDASGVTDLTQAVNTISGDVDTLVDQNEVIAAALVDLDDRKMDASAYTPTDLSNYYNKTDIDNRLGSGITTTNTVTKVIEENEVAIAAAIAELDDEKQDALVSGENIKTINQQSLIGSGDIAIESGFKKFTNPTASTKVGLVNSLVTSYGTDIGNLAVIEGSGCTASGTSSHAEGNGTTAGGTYSHAEGFQTKASGSSSHAEGYSTVASGTFGAHAEGYSTVASGNRCHAEGYNTVASGEASHAEGCYTKAIGYSSHAEGYYTSAATQYSHAEGYQTIASADFACHAEGCSTKAYGDYSHAEGYQTSATTSYTHSEGYRTKAIGVASHAEGSGTTASGNTSHAEGSGTTASGIASHAEGYKTIASGNDSHAEGNNTTASGNFSHAEGYYTSAATSYTHSEGFYTKTTNQSEHASGQYNISSKANTTFGNSGNTLFSVGNGYNSTATTHNAFEIRQNGDIYIANTDETTHSNYYQKDMYRLQDTIGALGGMKIVKITQSEYSSLSPKDPDTIYIVI